MPAPFSLDFCSRRHCKETAPTAALSCPSLPFNVHKVDNNACLDQLTPFRLNDFLVLQECRVRKLGSPFG